MKSCEHLAKKTRVVGLLPVCDVRLRGFDASTNPLIVITLNFMFLLRFKRRGNIRVLT
jgi:hypothetical protein